MNAHKNGIRLLVAERDPVVERDENVACASEDGLELRVAQLAIDPHGDIECLRLFRWSMTSPGTAVFSAVPGIDYNGLKGMAGVGGDTGATAKKKKDRQGRKGDETKAALHEN
jgi:hypothetical protein